MKRALRVLLGACALMGLTLSSHATIVTQWDATVSATWTNVTPSSGVTVSGGGTVLSWGTPDGSGQSSLTITNPSAGESVTTYVGGGTPPASDIASGGSLTHHNVPITGTSLTGATIHDTLTLTAVNPPSSGPGLLPALSFDIAFLETPNSTPCAAASPPGNPCNDIFVLLGGFLNQSFNYLGQQYFINAFPTSGGVLSVLSNSACAAVHAVNSAAPATGCFGFTTPEGQDTTLAFGFTISTQPLSVPEPGTIALVGLALLGLAVARRHSWMR
ncbi:MAG: THxN family PEP-CTERM protein [Rhodoferax sp.]|nr:THxN family PEP-CTERM protein [Rhodoferax sp.]